MTSAITTPATEEMKQVIASVERATGCHVLLVSGVLKEMPEAQEAAALACQIVYNNENPDGAWEAESKGTCDRLIELCGLAAYHPFKATPCPLQPREIEAALAWIREAFIAKKDGATRELAKSFMAWAANEARL